ncbi:MAG: hypothetical protein M1418_10045, partial [Deltaproteobacteria bacterium]|nr:hypothetical protein [Deltaproteobacteria bacterium]
VPRTMLGAPRQMKSPFSRAACTVSILTGNSVIRNLQREIQIAMIVVSHDLGVIRLLCQRTLVMRYGRIVESGLTDQVFEDPQHMYTQLLVSSQL